MRVAIVEDERLCAEQIQNYLQTYTEESGLYSETGVLFCVHSAPGPCDFQNEEERKKVLIFGISDESEMIGLDEPESEAEKISELIKTRLDPIPEFNLRFYKKVGIVSKIAGQFLPFFRFE